MNKVLYKVSFLFLALFLFTACSSKIIKPENFSPNGSTTNYLFFSNVEYDDYGRPSFTNSLEFRPTQADVLYYIVQYDNGVASSYFLIKTSETEGEYEDAMKIIYEDTFTGFEGGLQITQGALRSNNSGGSAESQAVYAVIALGAPIIGAVGGFLYGIVHSSAELVNQVNESLFVEYKENLVVYTNLKYDKSNRLIYLHEYDNFKKNVYSRKYEYTTLSQTPCRVRHIVTGEEKLYLEDDSCADIKKEVF